MVFQDEFDELVEKRAGLISFTLIKWIVDKFAPADSSGDAGGAIFKLGAQCQNGFMGMAGEVAGFEFLAVEQAVLGSCGYVIGEQAPYRAGVEGVRIVRDQLLDLKMDARFR